MRVGMPIPLEAVAAWSVVVGPVERGDGVGMQQAAGKVSDCLSVLDIAGSGFDHGLL